MSDHVIQNLDRTIGQLQDAAAWLARSDKICRTFSNVRDYTPEELDAFEALSSRFARVIDILLSKLFRGIDAAELESGGSLIDVVNRAHKRGLFDEVSAIRFLKDLRNQIANEYASSDLIELFQTILKYTPQLQSIVAKSLGYAKECVRKNKI